MAGTLFVVATPIGHLDDITVRALRVLREVSLVAAEDTRRSGNLLRHFGIPTRLVSLHAHNERSRAPQVVARLQHGESVAVMSDAGTPGISDPGAELVRLARRNDIRVEAVPGASAVSAAISVAGLEEGAFAFLGFPPTRSKDRKLWWSRFTYFRKGAAVVWFEAPHRVLATLTEAIDYVERPMLAFRELTKLHEETLSGTPQELIAALAEPRGEFTFVVPAQKEAAISSQPVSADELRRRIGHLIKNGAGSRRAAARLLADEFGLSTKYVYDVTRDAR